MFLALHISGVVYMNLNSHLINGSVILVFTLLILYSWNNKHTNTYSEINFNLNFNAEHLLNIAFFLSDAQLSNSIVIFYVASFPVVWCIEDHTVNLHT